MTDAHPTEGEVLAARRAVTAVFFLNGTGFASLFSRLPQIKADLSISDAERAFRQTAGVPSTVHTWKPRHNYARPTSRFRATDC